MMAKEYTYEDFLDIIKTLRSENGCPWDREQTHESLRPCMMEEAAEAVAAIRIWKETGNAENLREELGDVLLQVVMHACIAEEEGIFTMAEVVNEIAEKMVRRHPHVFGSTEVENSAQVLQNWEEIKKQEKEGKSWIESPLREIPRELPALTRAPKVIKKADKYYGRPRSCQDDIAVLKKAVEILEKSDEKQMEQCVEKELGDILMAVSDLASLYKKPLEQLLTDRIDDLIDNYENEMP
ncbi:MAG: MazG family protein [Lachnospiraceae bacterium]|nr:MazG family protein [Lachnospiraceae bacterium]